MASVTLSFLLNPDDGVTTVKFDYPSYDVIGTITVDKCVATFHCTYNRLDGYMHDGVSVADLLKDVQQDILPNVRRAIAKRFNATYSSRAIKSYMGTEATQNKLQQRRRITALANLNICRQVLAGESYTAIGKANDLSAARIRQIVVNTLLKVIAFVYVDARGGTRDQANERRKSLNIHSSTIHEFREQSLIWMPLFKEFEEYCQALPT